VTDDLHISQDDLVLHAMQALSYEEAESLRHHLASCAECRGRLAAANGDLALIALSVARKPVPDGAKERFLQKIATVGAAGGARPTPVTRIDNVPARRSSPLAWLAAAALLLLSAGLGFQIMRLNDKLRSTSERAEQLATANADLTAENAHAHEVLEVMTAPHVQRAVLTASASRPVPTGRAVYLAESGALIFQGSNLARLPETKTYELWLIPANGQAPMPAGMFRPDAAGYASVMMPPLPKGVTAKAFGVTVENAGGSSTPTMPILLSGAATAAGE
jgi:Anti-sigma-K factor rskA/Putative zinc-finger